MIHIIDIGLKLCHINQYSCILYTYIIFCNVNSLYFFKKFFFFFFRYSDEVSLVQFEFLNESKYLLCNIIYKIILIAWT